MIMFDVARALKVRTYESVLSQQSSKDKKNSDGGNKAQSPGTLQSFCQRS